MLFPCLNEEAAIGACVDAALAALEDAGLDGEVLVVDNASTDRSAEVAQRHGARVVTEPRRGYGSAYLRGLAEARGRYTIMLDADGTYPAERIGQFVKLLSAGRHDMVLGNRFAGMMAADAMPLLNRYLGNPALSGMTRLLFRVGLRDMHCGMRAIITERARELALRTPGMEFATEMIVKALDHDLRVAEIGIPYRPRVGDSKLVPWRDGWRHVEYMLVFSPGMLFLGPGFTMFTVGLLVQLALLSGPVEVAGRPWDVHTNLAGLALGTTGATLAGLGGVSAAYAWTLGMRFRHSGLARRVAQAADRPWRFVGLALMVSGLLIWLGVFAQWTASGFGSLAAVPVLSFATTLAAAGVESMAVAFVIHLIRLER